MSRWSEKATRHFILFCKWLRQWDLQWAFVVLTLRLGHTQCTHTALRRMDICACQVSSKRIGSEQNGPRAWKEPLQISLNGNKSKWKDSSLLNFFFVISHVVLGQFISFICADICHANRGGVSHKNNRNIRYQYLVWAALLANLSGNLAMCLTLNRS